MTITKKIGPRLVAIGARLRAGLGLLIVGAVALGLGWMLRGNSGAPMSSTTPDGGAPNETANVKWWTCAMHMQVRLPRPGKCPLCGMKLIPVTTTAGGGMVPPGHTDHVPGTHLADPAIKV